jgi:hypothetical protein
MIGNTPKHETFAQTAKGIHFVFTGDLGNSSPICIAIITAKTKQKQH